MRRQSQTKSKDQCPATKRTKPKDRKVGKADSRFKPPYKSDSKGTKKEREAEEIADTAAQESRGNPVQFYDKFKQFADDAAKVNFTRPLGAKFTHELVEQGGARVRTQETIPGIMRINFSPAIGVSNNVDSAMNRSSIDFYTRLRAKMRITADFDHQDLTIMMVAADSCIMFHSLARRIYGMLTDMSPVNRYYPRAIINACGVAYTNLQQTIQDFRAWINQFGLRIQQFALPTDLQLFDRHVWMCEGIYMDGVSSRAQTYIFVPTGFWQYSNTGSVGSELKWVPYPGTTGNNLLTVEQFMEFGNSLLEPIAGDSDFADISGALKTFYGGDVYKVPYVTETYAIAPSYKEMVLAQIENAVIMGNFAANYTPVITQNPNVNEGAIIYQPVVNPMTNYVNEDLYMNFHVEAPDGDLVLEATRLMATWGTATTEGQPYRIVASCGTEIVHTVDILTINITTGEIDTVKIDRQQHIVQSSSTNGTIWAQQILKLIDLSKFDWAPRIVFTLQGGTAEAPTFTAMGDSWDTETFDQLALNYFENIEEACLYSLFNIEA